MTEADRRSLAGPDPTDPARLIEVLTLSNQDLRHRLSNLIAVISSLVSVCARGRPEAQPFARELIDRLAALAVASQSETEDGEAELAAVARRVLAAHADNGTRVSVRADALRLSTSSATALALILNELATNSAKHGALSEAEGHVVVDGVATDGDGYRLTWTERGGPGVSGAPQRQGVGTLLIDRLAGQLHAKLDRDWMPEGLRVRLQAPAARLGA